MHLIQIETECITPSQSSKCLGVVWIHNLSPKASFTLHFNKDLALGSLGITRGNQTHSRWWSFLSALLSLWLAFDRITTQAPCGFPVWSWEEAPETTKIPFKSQYPIALGWPTMCYYILSRKIDFFFKLLHSKHRSISSNVFNALENTEKGPLILQQCRLLNKSMANSAYTSIWIIKKRHSEAVQKFIGDQVANHNSLSLLSKYISWPRLWDTARDHGPQAASSLLAVLKMLTLPPTKRHSSAECLCSHLLHC